MSADVPNASYIQAALDIAAASVDGTFSAGQVAYRAHAGQDRSQLWDESMHVERALMSSRKFRKVRTPECCLWEVVR